MSEPNASECPELERVLFHGKDPSGPSEYDGRYDMDVAAYEDRIFLVVGGEPQILEDGECRELLAILSRHLRRRNEKLAADRSWPTSTTYRQPLPVGTRSRSATIQSYFVWACPECGEQEIHHRYDDHRPGPTYCLNHEGEARANRPEHVRVEVVRRDNR